MADITLTPEQIEAIAEETYNKILEGSANSIVYDKVISAPTTDAERARWSIPAIRDATAPASRQAGNINLQAAIEGFGAQAVAEIDAAVDEGKGELNTLKTTLSGQLKEEKDAALSSIGTKQAAAESALEDKETALEGTLDTYAEGLKPELQAYVDEAEGQAQLATQKANEAGGKADDAEASKDEAALLLTQIQALKAQIEALSQSKVVAPAMVEGAEMGITLTTYGGNPYLALSQIETVDEEETA